MWKDRYREWLQNCNREGRADLLAIAENEKEIYERFASELQFGTAGIRGKFGYGTNCMNIYTVARATQGLAQYICSLGAEAMEQGVAIAYDTRSYSYTFAQVTAKVLAKNNVKSYLYSQPQPVPILSYTVQKLGTVAGVMITASHNPKEYNGYKVYGAFGSQMSLEGTAKIVEEIAKVDYFSPLQNCKNDHLILSVPQTVIKEYYNYVQSLSLQEQDKGTNKGTKLVYSALHGTGKVHVEALLKAMGVKVEIVEAQSMPDGNFSTVAVPNPEIKESLKMAIELAKAKRATAVFATDPDADRLGVAVQDDNGEFIQLTGNQVGILLLNYILETRKRAESLPENAVVVKSFVSSSLAQKICQKYGVTLLDVPVGFKFIGEKIAECQKNDKQSFLFGFEESCGYLYGDRGSKDKDAVLAAVLFAEFANSLEEKGQTVYQKLQEMYVEYGYAMDSTQNIAFYGLAGMQEMTEVVDRIRHGNIEQLGGKKVLVMADYAKGVRRLANGEQEEITMPKNNAVYFELEGGSTVAVRPSGTEPKLKIYYSIVAENLQEAKSLQTKLQDNFAIFLKKV